MKVLITGIKGFVATNLSKFFTSEGVDYLAISLRGGWHNQVSLDDFDAVIHLAGLAHDLNSKSLEEDYYNVNSELTKQLYEAYINSSATKFIFLSSVKAAADSVIGVLKEVDAANPNTIYGKSKLKAERAIIDASLNSEKTYYILRPCMIHGSGNKGNLNLLYNFITRKIPYPLAAFENKRSFLSIGNFNFVINELLKTNDIPSGIYNVADTEPLSTNSVVKIISASVKIKAQLWYVPRSMIRALAKVGDVFSLPINSSRLSKLTENYVVSNEKLLNALRKDLPISSEEGLFITAGSFAKK